MEDFVAFAYRLLQGLVAFADLGVVVDSARGEGQGGLVVINVTANVPGRGLRADAMLSVVTCDRLRWQFIEHVQN